MERKRRVLSPSAGLIRRSLISGLPAVLPYLLSMLILFTGITFQFVLTYDILKRWNIIAFYLQ